MSKDKVTGRHLGERPIGENMRSERAASDDELAARKAASDAEWRIAHGWPDPNPPDRVPNEWEPRVYYCPLCSGPVTEPGKWRHMDCTPPRGRVAPRPVELP